MTVNRSTRVPDRLQRELKETLTMSMSLFRITDAVSKLLLAGVAVLALGMVSAKAQETTRPTYTLYADGLACPFCAYGIEKQLSKIEGLEDIGIDIETGTVILTMAEGATLEEATARKAVEAAGFSLRDFEQTQ